MHLNNKKKKEKKEKENILRSSLCASTINQRLSGPVFWAVQMW